MSFHVDIVCAMEEKKPGVFYDLGSLLRAVRRRLSVILQEFRCERFQIRFKKVLLLELGMS